MKTLKKAKKESKPKQLTKEYLLKNLKMKGIDKLEIMLATPLYELKVKKALFEAKKISVKGFLFNDDVYSLPLGIIKKGEVHLSNDVLRVLDRFMLSLDFIEKNELMTSFLIDTDDNFYSTLISCAGKPEKEDDYNHSFNMSVVMLKDVILEKTVTKYLIDNKALFSKHIK